MSNHLARAQLLLEQSRPQQAEQELRKYLGEEPRDAVGHSLLAQCMSALGRDKDALAAAREGVHLAPDACYTHFALALVLEDQNRLDEAEAAIKEALLIDPEDADYLGLLAGIKVRQEKWSAGLRVADRGLQVDPEHAACANLRALALVKLGRKREAGATLKGVLARNPEDAASHANQGWTLLHQGGHKKALEHFQEALRIEPDMEWAREGIVEALKARNPVYRVILRWTLWMSRLSSGARWGLVIGLFILARLVRGLANLHEEFKPFAIPILMAYLVLVTVSWLGEPFFNLVLRLNPMGRHALSRDQTRGANSIGLLLLGALVFGGCFFLWPARFIGASALISLAMLFPVAGMFRTPAGTKSRRNAVGYVLVMTVSALATIAVCSVSTGTVAVAIGVTFALLWIASTWVMSLFILRGNREV
jgi:tetratricopeptide (TPR) repeat protein